MAGNAGSLTYRERTKPWYGTARWKARRAEQLNREPLCCMCMEMGKVAAASIADHKLRHNGDAELFWFGELQSLCKHCHDSHKQSEERTGKRKRVTGPDGWPID